MASDFSRRATLDRFLASLDAYDIAAWAVPNGRLYRRFAAWGFAISCIRDLRPELADYDIDGEVSMPVPRAKFRVSLRQKDFTLALHYDVWNFQGLLSPQQLVRAGGATELHLKADATPIEQFLLWLEQTVPRIVPTYH